MTTNSGITIYHYDDASEGYSVLYIPRASVHQVKSIDVDNQGATGTSFYSIRIPIRKTPSDFSVSLGDLVSVNMGGNTPVRSQCYKVVRIAKNLRGISPHLFLQAIQ